MPFVHSPRAESRDAQVELSRSIRGSRSRAPLDFARGERRETLALALLALLAACGAPLPAPASRADVFAPLGEPLPGVTAEQRAAFERGREVFSRRFAREQGLGPEYSAVSCGGCHERPVAGGTASRYRDTFVVLGGKPAFELPFQPHFSTEEAARAPTPAGRKAATRAPAAFFGIGLLAELPFDELLSRSDPADADGDGISGRLNFERGFAGRFGRKAQMASLQGFVRLALKDHLGVTTRPVPREGLLEVPEGPLELATRDADGAADPELAPEALAELLAFVSLLAPPAPDPLGVVEVRGQALFSELGCAACHAPALKGPRGELPAYTDLLLHDLGPELADGVALGEALPSELRTAPLWGVAAGGPYLHDGRADTLEEAILWHGGEAAAARERYAALDARDREGVLGFLRALGGAAARSDGLLPPNAAAPAQGELGGPGQVLQGEPLARFLQGRALFDRDFGLSSGLGPRFNGDACRSCHFDGAVGGAGPADVDVLRQGGVAAARSLLHRHASDGLRPEPAAEATFFERRQTPPLFGLGLVDAISSEAILAAEDPEDRDGDGIRGRAARLPDGRLGRFGWKANVATLAEFTRDALSNELGLTLPSQLTATVGASVDGDAVADPELSLAQVEALTFFLEQLAPPKRRGPDPGARGEQLFTALRCAACHTPSLPARDGTPVRLYSDLLLHDVAAPDAPRVEDPVAGRAFRTPPLWGVSRSAPYLHDGSAPTLERAVLLHAGEATRARAAFEAASAEERAALLGFLEGL